MRGMAGQARAQQLRRAARAVWAGTCGAAHAWRDRRSSLGTIFERSRGCHASGGRQPSEDPRAPSLTGFRPVVSRAMRTRILLLAMLICAALPMAADARPKVVVDADMSFDDAATLAYLAQADRHGFIDLDAVTVSLSGTGYTGRGLSHARCLLRKHGLPGVRVFDGDALGA